MPTITIPKKEYQELVEKKFRYEYLRAVVEEEIFSPPPTRSRKEILKALKGAKKISARVSEERCARPQAIFVLPRMKILSLSFRIDRKYRAIFIFRDKNTIEIIDVNNHYQ